GDRGRAGPGGRGSAGGPDPEADPSAQGAGTSRRVGDEPAADEAPDGCAPARPALLSRRGLPGSPDRHPPANRCPIPAHAGVRPRTRTPPRPRSGTTRRPDEFPDVQVCATFEHGTAVACRIRSRNRVTTTW